VLALSAFDHPPMAWWIAHFAGSLLGEGDLALRLPFILLFAATSWTMFALTRRLFGAEAGFFAVLALSVSPVLGFADAAWILPDAPLLPAMLGCVYALVRVFFDGEGASRRAPAYWLLAGFCAGLALLSKYHGVLLFAGAGLFMLASRRHRFWLATIWPWLAALLAAAMFAPVVAWNAQHNWVSFAFQGGRAGAAHLHLLAPLVLVGLQSLLLAPWIFLPLVLLFVGAVRKGAADERGLFLACLAAPAVLIFTLVAFWSSGRALPHWVAPGYLLLVPLLGRAVAERLSLGAAWLRRGVAAAVVFVAAAVAVVAALPLQSFGFMSGPRYPLRELLDWDDFTRAYYGRGLADRGSFVAATRWLDAGRLDFALHGAAPVLCLSDDPRGFGVVRDPSRFVGLGALIVAPDLTLEQARARLGKYFDAIDQEESVDIVQGGGPVIVLRVYRGRNFHDPSPAFSLGLASRGGD
jgi:hypothetical protein